MNFSSKVGFIITHCSVIFVFNITYNPQNQKRGQAKTKRDFLTKNETQKNNRKNPV
jgi:hypothetical protein